MFSFHSQVERENISKLEKADILELTVRHLSKQRGPRDPRAEVERFQAGFGHCASEAYQFILSSPGIDANITQQLVRHLSAQMNEGPIGIPALASPVPSDSSLSPSTSSRGYSPNYYTEQRHSRPVISPVEYLEKAHPAWKEDSPSVPIEQSLTCDVAPFNSRPAIARNPEPMTGLLMTVNTECAPRNVHTDNTIKRAERQRTPEVKERFDSRGSQNSETKNLIMQKIREHILERQHRESDIQDPPPKQSRIDYPTPPPNHIRHLNYPNSDHFLRDETHQFSLSKDVRNMSFSHREPNPRVMQQVLTPSTSEEAINLSAIPIQQRSPKSVEGTFKASKHQADYKSIHPKKVMIRIPQNNSDFDMGGDVYGQGYSKPAINDPRPAIKDQQVSSPRDRQLDDSDVSAAEAYYLRYKQQQFQDPMDADDAQAWRPW